MRDEAAGDQRGRARRHRKVLDMESAGAGGQGLQSTQVEEAQVPREDQVSADHTAAIGYPGRESGHHCISQC